MTPPAALPFRVAAAAATTAIALIAAVAACSDKPAQPTAPRAPVQVAPAVVTGPATAGVSTVCLAYMTKQSVAQQKLDEALKGQQSVDDQLVSTLRSRVEKLDEIVADACN